jgi:hypothetical protein
MLSRCSLVFAAAVLLTYRAALADDAVELTDVILANVAAQSPPDSPPLSQVQIGDVKWVVRTLSAESYYPIDSAEARRSIESAIASAASRPGPTAASLARAGVEAVVATIGQGASTVNLEAPVPVRSRQPAVRSTQFGAVHVISIARLERAGPCKGTLNELPRGEHNVVVLDLRGNEGGVLSAVPELAGQFLAPKLPLFKLRDKSGRVSEFSTVNCTTSPNTSRLAIWIDQRTDSGALLLAAVLQDHGRAIVLGEQKPAVNGSVSGLFFSPTRALLLNLPIGELLHAQDRPLRDGMTLDARLPADDGLALLDATVTHLAKPD